MSNIQKYSEIKVKISQLTAEAKELESSVSEEVSRLLIESGEPTHKTELGSFFIKSKKNITYSSEVENKVIEIDEKIKPLREEIDPLKEKIAGFEKELSVMKKQEEKEGIATFEIISKSAVFTPNK